MNAGRGAGIFLLLLALGLGLAEVAAQSGAGKSPAAERALRRAFDGAPPVIPHERFPSPCIECHNGAWKWSGGASPRPARTNSPAA